MAIEHLHAKGIAYRDLKPENILIDQAGYVRLTDFGLSKADMTPTKRTYSVCGTPEYLAPEVLFKVGHGMAVDWWAVGSLIFEMLTGFPPFYSPNREELLHRIKYEAVKLPNSLPRDALSLLEGLLRKDPERRLGSGPKGAADIKRHRWFAEVDWDLLLKKQYAAPFTPRLRSGADVSYFDKVPLSFCLQFLIPKQEFTKAPINSFDASESRDDSRTYEGFSFCSSELLSDPKPDEISVGCPMEIES